MNFTPKDSDDYDIELVSNSFNGALASKSGYDTKQKIKLEFIFLRTKMIKL